MGYGTPQEILDNYTLQECYDTGFYKTALGNVIKVPDNFTDQNYIYAAIIKRFRKEQRNIAVNANAWMAEEHGVPLPRISL